MDKSEKEEMMMNKNHLQNILDVIGSLIIFQAPSNEQRDGDREKTIDAFKIKKINEDKKENKQIKKTSSSNKKACWKKKKKMRFIDLINSTRNLLDEEQHPLKKLLKVLMVHIFNLVGMVIFSTEQCY